MVKKISALTALINPRKIKAIISLVSLLSLLPTVIAQEQATGIILQGGLLASVLGSDLVNVVLTFSIVFAILLLATEGVFRAEFHRQNATRVSILIAGVIAAASAYYVSIFVIDVVSILAAYGIIVSVILATLFIIYMVMPDAKKRDRVLVGTGIFALAFGTIIPQLIPALVGYADLLIFGGWVLLVLGSIFTVSGEGGWFTRTPAGPAPVGDERALERQRRQHERELERVRAEAEREQARFNRELQQRDEASQRTVQELQNNLNRQAEAIQNLQNAPPQVQQAGVDMQAVVNSTLPIVRREIQQQFGQAQQVANQLQELQTTIDGLQQQISAQAQQIHTNQPQIHVPDVQAQLDRQFMHFQQAIGSLEVALTAMNHANRPQNISVSVSLSDLDQHIEDIMSQQIERLKQSVSSRHANTVERLERTRREEMAKQSRNLLLNQEAVAKRIIKRIEESESEVNLLKEQVADNEAKAKVRHEKAKGWHITTTQNLAGIRKLMADRHAETRALIENLQSQWGEQSQELKNIAKSLASFENNTNRKLNLIKKNMLTKDDPVLRKLVETVEGLQGQISTFTAELEKEIAERTKALEGLRDGIIKEIGGRLVTLEGSVEKLVEAQKLTHDEIEKFKKELETIAGDLKLKIRSEGSVMRGLIGTLMGKTEDIDRHVVTVMNRVEKIATSMRGIKEEQEKEFKDIKEGVTTQTKAFEELEKKVLENKALVQQIENLKRDMEEEREVLDQRTATEINQMRGLLESSEKELESHIKRIGEVLEALEQGVKELQERPVPPPVPPVPPGPVLPPRRRTPTLAIEPPVAPPREPEYKVGMPEWLFNPILRLAANLRGDESEKLHSDGSFYEGQTGTYDFDAKRRRGGTQTAPGNVERRIETLAEIVRILRQINHPDLNEYVETLERWRSTMYPEFLPRNFTSEMTTFKRVSIAWIKGGEYEDSVSFASKLDDFIHGSGTDTGDAANRLFLKYKKFIQESKALRRKLLAEVRAARA